MSLVSLVGRPLITRILRHRDEKSRDQSLARDSNAMTIG